ncbi:helix-turn-helix domain-containing protein [Amycolatopsis sp. NBC_01488]|uniref:helix-turn-helix domain-containing protein n=1 Tax=Amycolatopsis sp. NBC_01488 TaxID=2903563 RepID=UPI002E29BDCD|nr:helix-turn-helix transcriptional regulator [Amycolatopsis sp. NBC_01488]
MVESSRSALKRWIGTELKRLRQRAGYERADVAERLGKTGAWPGHVEVGRNLPSAADLEVLLTWYGHVERLTFFRTLLTRAKKGRDWWIGFSDVTPEWFNVYLGLESIARQLSGYDAMVVHGLFQLPEYAEAVIRDVNPTLPDAEVNRRVELRMARHEVLTHRTDMDPLRVWRVIDEAALRRVVGNPAIARRQLEQLVKLAEMPNITLQVLPASAGSHPGIEGTFTIMDYPAEFEDDPGTVWIESRIRGTFIEEPAEISIYRDDLTRLQAHKALKPEQSIALIEQVTKEITR